MPSLRSAIPIIMDRFDFEKVLKVMVFLNWTWAGSRPNAAPLTVEDLKGTAYYIMHVCVDEFEKKGRPGRGMSVATGGFQAIIQCFENGDPCLQLDFYVDHSSSTGEC